MRAGKAARGLARHACAARGSCACAMGRRATGHGPRLPASRPHADRAGRQQAAVRLQRVAVGQAWRVRQAGFGVAREM